MDIFQILTMAGGLSLFLFGMGIMGQALERRAGNRLRTTLGRMTSGRLAGFLTGCGVTAVIQSSSATTVMVVGFVNSGLMTLRQAINVIMGANVGTTVTGWLLSLSGIDSSNLWMKLLKPSSFAPVLAFIGILNYMFSRSSKKKDTGMIFLGFATLMFGMETMSGAVSGLADLPEFRQLFVLFKNPLAGLLAGAFLTAVIQSSSASVGILQVLAATGQISFGAAVPIIMGQNIGTCATAIISAVGASKNARRAAFVHLSFNVAGSVVLLTIFTGFRAFLHPGFLDASVSRFDIAVIHTIFNVACVVILMPLASLLEKLAVAMVHDDESPEKKVELDERLLAAPPLALEQCRNVAVEMAQTASRCLSDSISSLSSYTPKLAQSIRSGESMTDHYEDILGTYLVKLSSQTLNEADSEEVTVLLKIIGDYERIGDHALNILESAEELREKKNALPEEGRPPKERGSHKMPGLSEEAVKELKTLSSAVEEVLSLSLAAFEKRDKEAACRIEPLEQVIDELKEEMRTRHIYRMRKGDCSIEAGFVWSDLLTDLERTSDHCSNIAGCIIDAAEHTLNLHTTLRKYKNGNEEYDRRYHMYGEKYRLSQGRAEN